MPRKRKTPILPASSVPTGLPYGQHQALENQQTQLAGQIQGGGPGTPPAAGDVASAFKQMPFPSQKLNDPTARPDEPITAGMTPLGQSQAPVVSPTQSLGSMLQQLALSPNTNPEVQFLSQFVQSGRL